MKKVFFSALALALLTLSVGCSDNKGSGPTVPKGGIQTTLTPAPIGDVNSQKK